MKLNFFSVPDENLPALKAKFDEVGLSAIHTADDGAWQTAFYFSDQQGPTEIPWVSTFSDFFGESRPQHLIYFAAYLFQQPGHAYLLTFGKAHFYVRPFCDHDFGIEVAKRIADEDDIKQKASKRFAGRRKKEIGSYNSNTPLDVESGESVDYLQAGIIAARREEFGRTAKFGASVLLNAPINQAQIGELLGKVTATVASPPSFSLPRTAVISDETEIAHYDGLLLDAIASDDSSTDFTHTGHDIVGVDFVFSGNEQYTLTAGHHRARSLGEADLDLGALRSYLKDLQISRGEILGIRIKVQNEGQRLYSKGLKDSLDYIVDGENVMLSQGRWLRFNEDYVDQLNASVDGIEIDPTEPEFTEIAMGEPEFSDSKEVVARGYTKADMDFSKIRTRVSTPIEAWDLRQGGTVYAVKFGTAQKLSYVCDQANAVVEILRNNANVKKLDPGLHAYCLWLGFKTASVPARMSQVNSIILKQKIDAWARGCRNLGIQPSLKFSRRI